jgi:hypothetical protein
MQAAIVGKVLGWGQFLFQVLSQVFATGFPHGAAGWLSLAGSLAAAIGIHAASSTDGGTGGSVLK